jgi:hypothetical protein
VSDQPREPMPESWKPVWRFMVFLTGVTIAIGVAAAIIDMLIRQ